MADQEMNDSAPRCESKLPWVGDRVCDCMKPMGHRGVHRCLCGTDWLNEADYSDGCTSSEVMVLGVLDGPVRVRCGLQEDHNGPHRVAMEWGHDA